MDTASESVESGMSRIDVQWLAFLPSKQTVGVRVSYPGPKISVCNSVGLEYLSDTQAVISSNLITPTITYYCGGIADTPVLETGTK